MKFRALLVTKDGFNCLDVQQHAAAVNQGLENLIHVPAARENKVAAVFDLIVGILVMKPATFLLFQIKGETQATAVNPTLADLTGSPYSVEWREIQLIALRSMMKDHAEDFCAALWTDLRRNRIEADWVDVKYMTSEIDHVLAHLRHWMKPLPVSTPLLLAPSHGQVRFDPLGVGLIIGTWNYPVMLTLSPLVAAISAGNAAVIKPSEVSAATAEVMAQLVPQYLDRKAFSLSLDFGLGAIRERQHGDVFGPWGISNHAETDLTWRAGHGRELRASCEYYYDQSTPALELPQAGPWHMLILKVSFHWTNH